jgi:tripartite-type tricarboxylate transporter receptor subunit TctC
MPIQSSLRALLAAGVVGVASSAAAQTYPDKVVTFVVPFAAGSATDGIARAIGQEVAGATKQGIVVENKPGANAFIGAQAAAKAPADGYTVFITTNTTQAANPHLFRKLPYDPVKDFAPVTLLGSGSSSSRIAGELFQQMAGVELLHVPYKSNPPAVTDLLGGQIHMMFTDTVTGLPHVKSGKLRALGVTAKRRSELLPDVPTIDEAGVKGYESTYWFAAYVPAKTPPEVVTRLQDILVKAVNGAAAQQFYRSTGTEPVTSTPDELAKFQAAEMEKWGRIVKAAKIEPE